MTPSSKASLNFTFIETPLGQMIAMASAQGICLLEFCESPEKTMDLSSISQFFDAEIIEGSNQYIVTLKIELEEYFEGTRKEFSVPLVMNGTPFQQKVWTLLQEIPYGTTQTYKQQADNLKQPLAIRAMAHANGQNRIAIIVPCHRVIGSNGKLTGYAGGIGRKKSLLEHERIHSPLGDKLL